MMAASEPWLPKYMKYKRRYYNTDDYTTRTLDARSGTAQVSDVDKTPSATGKKLSGFSTQSNDQQTTRELSPCYSDQRHCPPKKRHLVCGDLGPEAEKSLDEPHSTADSFLLNLENQQTTQEICMALLSMAFWRPESGQNGEDRRAEPRNVDVGELPNGEEVDNTDGSVPEMKDNTPAALYSQDNVNQEIVVVRGTHNNCCARTENRTGKYCEGGSGTTETLPSVVDPVNSSARNQKMDNPDISTEEQHKELRCPDDPGLCLGNITDCANRDSRDADCIRLCVSESFVHSVNDRVQTSLNSTNSTTLAFQNTQTGVGVGSDPCKLPCANSSCSTSHQTTVMAQTSHGPSQSDDAGGAHSPNTEFASPKQYSDSKQIADSPTSPEVSKVLSLFPKPARGRQLWEIVEIMARRHREDYFIGWTADESEYYLTSHTHARARAKLNNKNMQNLYSALYNM